MFQTLTPNKTLYAKRALFSRIKFDWPLMLIIFTIGSIGLCVLYSAKPEWSILQRQMVRWFMAFGLMMCAAQTPPRFFKALAPWLYGATLILLATVLIIGHISKGAQRWLDVSLFRFQPAELMKIAVPLVIARYFDHRHLPPKFSQLIIPMLLVLVPTLLVAKQPDLGTALLILSSGALVIFFSGISWNLLISLCVLMLGSIPVLWAMMREYQKQRILVLLDPDRDPLGSGYHIIQSKIAIGSGGLTGKGWLNGTQSQLDFLPERTTDFVFAVFSEEFGWIGCVILLSLYCLLIFRSLHISAKAQDTFSRLLAGSIATTFFVYIFVNVGMVSGILPVVGVPLPLISYGGTSLMTLMFSLGILMSIHQHRSLIQR